MLRFAVLLMLFVAFVALAMIAIFFVGHFFMLFYRAEKVQREAERTDTITEVVEQARNRAVSTPEPALDPELERLIKERSTTD